MKHAQTNWTHFWDMHSGGGQKEDWASIYIEAPLKEAKVIFYNRFGHNPDRVTCTCCGPDYAVENESDLAQLTGFHRGCKHDGKVYVEEPDERSIYSYRTLDQYCASSGVLVIRVADIKPEERVGAVPQQGYVWID